MNIKYCFQCNVSRPPGTALKTIDCVFTIKGSGKKHFHQIKSDFGAKLFLIKGLFFNTILQTKLDYDFIIYITNS